MKTGIASCRRAHLLFSLVGERPVKVNPSENSINRPPDRTLGAKPVLSHEVPGFPAELRSQHGDWTDD